MSNISEPLSQQTERPRGRRIFEWAVALVILVTGSAIPWVSWDRFQPSSVGPATEANGAESNQNRADSMAALQQTVRDLQAAQQERADQLGAMQLKTSAALDDLKRQLAAEQGDRKLLAEQVGALSARIDSLVLTNAQATESRPTAVKRGRGSR